MKKNYLILAAIIASIGLASCSNEEYVGEFEGGTTGERAITFDLSTPAITRAEGKAAATALSNQFIIWGEKNETNGDAATAANTVFENYKVEWTDNSAFTTTSNTQNWEYVGLTPYTAAQVSPAISGTQSIKYWDYNASSYTFTAVSALSADITDGKVVITKNTSGTTVYDKGYEIAVKSGASLDNIFIADRNQPTVGTEKNREAPNAYGGNVRMTFRNFMSKIRFGIYENIPGYKVKITNVDYNSTNSTATSKFGVDGKFLVAGASTTFTVSYYSDNKATVAVKGTPNSTNYLETAQTVAGSPILNSTPTEISESASTPTYDKTGGAYTSILPFPTNDTSMKIQLDFTLTSDDTGETINVVDATAEIPATYCQWLPNYAYTYILKLNDNTNGQIQGVSGLYPITFDAVAITDTYNGLAEYITTVSNPSITTFGVKGGVYTTGKNEYEAGSDVYVTVMDGSSVANFTFNSLAANGLNVYKATTTDATNYPISEASVAESLAEISAKTHKITLTSMNSGDVSDCFTAVPAQATEVPSEDGSIVSVQCVLTADPGDWVASDANIYYSDAACTSKVTTAYANGTYYKKFVSALKLTGVKQTSATTAIVVEYIKTPATYKYVAVPIADATEFAAVKEALNLYTDNTGTEYDGSSAFNGETTYYKKVVDNPGVYAYKVIKVAAAE